MLGLTGEIGGGKSAASHWFETQGITVVNAEIVAREVVKKDNPRFKKLKKFLGIGYY